eukprot:g21434.t1
MKQAINISQQTTRAKKRQTLQDKLATLTHQNDNNRTDTWIRNLSDRKLTDTEKAFHTRGLNYNCRNANKTEFLATLEATLRTNNINEETQQTIRQTVILTLTRRSELNTLKTLERQALEGLEKDKKTTILPADKGCMTITLNKRDYTSKAQALLADENTFWPVKIEPTPQLGNKILYTLKKTQTNQTDQQSRLLKNETQRNQHTPILPKVHKPEVPLRPIVSLPGTPSHRLATELQRRLRHLVNKSPHSIHSAQECLNSIKDIRIDDEETMISFDVTALFTSIDIPRA